MHLATMNNYISSVTEAFEMDIEIRVDFSSLLPCFRSVIEAILCAASAASAVGQPENIPSLYIVWKSEISISFSLVR